MIDWVTIGTDPMKAARERKGLSYETAARLLHVSSKTYERYEKKGRVPVQLVMPLAEALDLEIEQPVRERVAVTLPPEDQPQDEVLGEIVATMRKLDRTIGRLRRDVRRLEARLPPSEGDQAADEPG